MRHCGMRRISIVSAALWLSAGAQMASGAEHTLMRFPALYGDTVAFEAHGNLWAVARTGGVARRLTADAGYDLMPRFSADGRWLAFTASYQGNRDVYVMPAGGGEARRLTFHSDVVDRAPDRWGPDNMVVTWTPDSKDIVFLSRRRSQHSSEPQLFEVPVTGGLATPLPLDSGGLASYSPDGQAIAYNRIFRNFRTWKRYDGGMAQDVYTYSFPTRTLERITTWKGTDTAPMWYRRKIYFLSDRDAVRRENIWAYDLDSKQFSEITHFTDYDIDFPSLSADRERGAGIVFQQGGSLWILDLPSEQLHRLEVVVPDDGVRTGVRFLDGSKYIREHDTAQQTDYALAPNGKRVLFSARGDIFSLPAEHGATRDLTDTSNADEDHPSWSPDGKTIAYTTDIDGEQQIATRPAEGGPQRILTHFTSGFLYTPVWSPDAKHLAFADGNQRLWLLDLASGATSQVAEDRYTEIHDQSFSPDGRWLAYSLTRDNQQRGIWIYSLESAKAQLVSDVLGNDFDPVFSPDGKYLYFVSSRHENPTLSEVEFDAAMLEMDGIYVATLRKSERSPFAPRSDEGAVEPEKPKPTPWKPGASAPIQIDFDGLMGRAVPLPIPAADIATLGARGDKLTYQTAPPQMIEGPLPGEKSALHLYDLSERKDGIIAEDLSTYSLSADGTKVLYKKVGPGDHYEIIDAKVQADGPAPKPIALDLSHMLMRIVPTEEWAEMFHNAWRLERDLFVNSRMNGVDWPAVREAYAKLLPLLGSREDLTYLIGEVQGELGNSHTYAGGGDEDDLTPPAPTPLLGVDFALDGATGLYRFAKIYPGDNTRPEFRSPLTEPGLDVHVGDYLLAVNGHELRAPVDPDSLFAGLGAQPLTLTVAPSAAGQRREVTVEPITNELSIRQRAWIDQNRQTVDRLSGGRIAYVYMADMERLGMEQFVRQFFPQLNKRALIVDDRWNGGGFIDQIVLERLRRILVGMDTNRERTPTTLPQQLIAGPKVCLLNHLSASDGDLFPYNFRKYGLGPLIGTRTWGGVRGIRGEWQLLDGGYITVPEDSIYGLHSEWVVENHGVDPDIEVDTDPAQLLAGHDAQLEAAVDYLLKELAKNPGGLPPPPPLLPAYPPDGQVPPPTFSSQGQPRG
ncbi:MAG TPA: PDZ domain-containing protein [Steroidobacteraceae bacterium]|nr:PDZ domain-containing protein [Steroidobacteraceae bacterium]